MIEFEIRRQVLDDLSRIRVTFEYGDMEDAISLVDQGQLLTADHQPGNRGLDFLLPLPVRIVNHTDNLAFLHLITDIGTS